MTIGADSALHRIMEAIDNIATTASRYLTRIIHDSNDSNNGSSSKRFLVVVVMTSPAGAAYMGGGGTDVPKR